MVKVKVKFGVVGPQFSLGSIIKIQVAILLLPIKPHRVAKFRENLFVQVSEKLFGKKKPI